MKKLVLLVAATSLLATAFAAPAEAEFHGVTCQLEGSAKLSPGLTSEEGKYNVVFSGDLSNCQSTGEATSGTVKAQATAEGTCAEATAEGHALIKWDTGKKTLVEFSTTDIGALVLLDYHVTKSNDDAALAGDQGYGSLLFQADPTACNTDAGIKEASFTGQVGSGSE